MATINLYKRHFYIVDCCQDTTPVFMRVIYTQREREKETHTEMARDDIADLPKNLTVF